MGSAITGKESAVILPTSSLNASVPVGLLNMYAASAKFKTELSRKDAATHQVAFFRASSNFSRVPRSSSAASIFGRSTTLSLSIIIFASGRRVKTVSNTAAPRTSGTSPSFTIIHSRDIFISPIPPVRMTLSTPITEKILNLRLRQVPNAVGNRERQRKNKNLGVHIFPHYTDALEEFAALD